MHEISRAHVKRDEGCRLPSPSAQYRLAREEGGKTAAALTQSSAERNALPPPCTLPLGLFLRSNAVKRRFVAVFICDARAAPISRDAIRRFLPRHANRFHALIPQLSHSDERRIPHGENTSFLFLSFGCHPKSCLCPDRSESGSSLRNGRVQFKTQ
ncbi:hypothetical protein CDAR_319141 [Caerostris darwini]|uniref:Uncharacterized protein n=1 Tax=Caerostris darwini TaxID=1538125 RepID=A0AAV4TZK7_9ARAC|nr:hypothetical protein CDAR_319141 [Caerostris darwini]